MGEETLFSWIHLSDIHVGHGDRDKPHGWNQVLVMEALRKDIASRPGPQRVDGILVTGDVAFSGDGLADDEYTRAKDWLVAVAAAAGVAPASIFLVPGNHDVNRKVDDDYAVGPIVELLRDGKRSLDDVLGKPQGRDALAKRMARYLAFAAGFAPWALDKTVPAAEQRLFWVKQIEASPTLRVRLVGLNTALLAKDVDEHKLQLGSEQLVTALMPPVADEGELVVVMSHHPLTKEWLADAKEAHAWIRNHAHVHVSGHVHEAESGELRAGSGTQLVHVVAGAVHGERLPGGAPASHGYNYGEIVHDGRGALELRVWPRRWSEPNKRFRLDVDSAPDGKPFATHRLPVRVAARPIRADAPVVSTPPAITPPTMPVADTMAHLGQLRAERALPEGPLPTFISYAPADKAALARLEVHLSPLKREKLIATWSAAEVGGGAEAKAAAAQRLAEARVILLLVSPDFLASDECHDVEMMTALARHDRREATVIPILVRDADFMSAPFARLQFLPWFRLGEEKPRPVYGGAGDPETAFTEIAKAIRGEIERLRGTAPRKR